jgi:hypothetical protein
MMIGIVSRLSSWWGKRWELSTGRSSHCKWTTGQVREASLCFFSFSSLIIFLSVKLISFTGSRWVNPNQPLHVQHITNDQIVTLKRKFFVEDTIVSINDPVQLHLEYAQSRDAIVSGKLLLCEMKIMFRKLLM